LPDFMSLPSGRAAVARAERRAKATGDPADVDAAREARSRYAEAKLADAIRKSVEAAPPLTPEQRDRLSALLRGGA